MSNETKRSGLFWKFAVVALIVVVGAQSAAIYYALSKKDNSQAVLIPHGDAIIRPRLNVPVQYPRQQVFQGHAPALNRVSQPQSLRPAPLPKLNLNLNTMPGVRVSQQTVNRQQGIQNQSPALSSGMRPGMNRMMGGMSGGSMNMQDEFERVQRMMESMFSNRGMASAMNRHSNARGLSMKAAAPTLSQDSNSYIVKLTIPGLDRSEINAEVKNNILTLSGVQKKETEENGPYGRSYSSSSQSFQNSFSLPGPIKSDGMQVDYENDILTVTVPKA